MSHLEKLFSPSQWNPKGKSSEEVLQEFAEISQNSFEDAKKKILALRDVDYGPNKLDIWGANAMNATHVFIFFHGGYWQAGSKENVGPMIDLVVNGAGIPCVSVGYDYATTKPLKEIAGQALTALKFIENRFTNAIFTVSGHSAGAYLAASAVSNLEDPRRIKQVILISGIYELGEFANTSDGKNIHLKESDATELNICPKKLANAMYRRRVTIFIAENDSPKFHEQADNLQKGIIEASEQAVECEKLLIRDDDHFSIIQNMRDRSCDPARHLLRRLRFF